jgi:hypothetical protein
VSRARRSVPVLLLAALLVGACAGGGGDRSVAEIRLATESFRIRVTPEPSPPRALEPVTWTVVVTDKETGAPIERGEGRIFASNRDGKNIANGFAPTEAIGTYRTTLNFVTSGTWALGLQFRRDSTDVLERTEDWTQDVRTAADPWDVAVPADTVRPDTARPDTPPPEGAVTPR